MLVLQALLRQGVSQPGCAVLLSPFSDMAVEGESILRNKNSDPFLAYSSLPFISDCATGRPDFTNRVVADVNKKNPLVNSLYGRFAGICPLLFQTSASEVLYSDTVRLADKARAEGVEVEVETPLNMVHCYPLYVGIFPEADEAFGRMVSFVTAKVQREGSLSSV